MVAVHEELAEPRVVTVVEDLAGRGASGILEVSGNPSGTVYLDDGRIVFAGASWVPGLAARLRGLRPPLAGLSDLAPGREADAAAVAGLALQRGYLTLPALHDIIKSIVVDAFLVLTVPLAMDAPVAAIRFTSTRTYWAEVFPRLGSGQVRGEALRTAERMAQHGLAPTTVVAPCDLRAPATVVTREQWAVACQIGGHASARDLAARRGAALSDTLESLGGLVRAGLCAPVRVSRRGHLPAPVPGQLPGPASPSGRSASPPPAGHLPARQPGQVYPGRADRPASAGQPPSPDVLRQVLNGLRKFS